MLSKAKVNVAGVSEAPPPGRRITDWPEGERPREKLMARGAEALTDAELLAIFLRTGTRGKTAVDLARDLLIEYGTLRALLHSKRERFTLSKGLGDAKYTQLKAVLEMGRRHMKEELGREDALNSPELTRNYLVAQMAGYAHEVFACLLLDNQNQVIRFEILFRGTIDSACVYPREVVRLALDYGATGIIFAHNHPSGLTQPSEADKQITQRLQQALTIMDIRVLDHFIIGDGDHPYSFAENGLL